MAGTRDDGKSYCETCLPTGHPPLVHCMDCGKTKFAYSKTLCEDCGWERSHQRLLAQLRPQFQTSWSSELFERYHQESRIYTLRGTWLQVLRRDMDFFLALEKAFASPQELTGVLIIRRIGWPVVCRHQRVMSFLAQQHLIVLDDDPDYGIEAVLYKIRERFAATDGWVAKVLQRFLQWMLDARARLFNRQKHARVPIAPRSIESAMRSAHDLLVLARDKHHTESIQALTQTALNLYIAGSKDKRIRIGTFIRYLRRQEKLFHRLRVPAIDTGFPYHLIMSDEDRLAAIDRIQRATTVHDLRWAVLGLFVGVYAQRPKQVAAMRLDQIRESADGHEVRFAKVWLKLDPLVDRVVSRWLAGRREFCGLEKTGESPYLFPGRRATTHMQSRSMARYRKRTKVQLRSLRASCIASLVQAGMRHPRLLMDAFGMCDAVALKYCRAFGANTGPRAGQVIQAHGH